MSCGIYSLESNGVCLYVGQSKDIETRFKRHIYEILNETHIRKDLILWVKENSSIDLIELVIRELCEDEDYTKNSLEIKWFNNLSPLFYGIEPSLNKKWVKTEETKIKIGSTLKNRNASKYKKKMAPYRDLIIEKCRDPKVYFKDLVIELGVNAKALRRYLKSEGIEFISPMGYKTQLLMEKKEFIFIDYFENGMTTREIAKKYDFHQPQIIWLFNKFRDDDKRFNNTPNS